MTVPEYRTLFDLLVAGSVYRHLPDEPAKTLSSLKRILPADEAERLSAAVMERADEVLKDLRADMARREAMAAIINTPERISA